MVVGLWSFLTYYLQPPSVSAIPYSMDYNNYYEKDGQDRHRSSSWNGSGAENAEPARSDAGLEIFETENEDSGVVTIPENNTTVNDECPFSNPNTTIEWAYNFPVLLILACNMLFLIYIMTVRK